MIRIFFILTSILFLLGCTSQAPTEEQQTTAPSATATIPEGEQTTIYETLVHIGDSSRKSHWTDPLWAEVPEPIGQTLIITFTLTNIDYTNLLIDVHSSELENNKVEVNGEHIGNLIKTGENEWKIGTLPLKEDLLKIGENTILISATPPDDLMVRSVSLV